MNEDLEITKAETWCVNAEHAMSANNDGSTKMCCMIRQSYNNIVGSSSDYFIGTKSIKENFDNLLAVNIRENLRNGIRDNACDYCWQEEDAGRKSKRQRDNDRYFHEVKWQSRNPYEGLAKFELNLGNNCNIKCRTCHPSISSTWMKESYDLDYSHKMTLKEYSNSLKRFHQQYEDDSPFWDDLANNLSTIKQFDFYGGEPFLSQKMWEILGICVDKGYAHEIELHYNTNGTNWPKYIEEFWPHFKSINLSFSIDGIGETFEYMRFPAKWDEVQENMQKARKYKEVYGNLNLSWCVTLSTINIYNLPEVIEEYYDNYTDFGIYLNLVHGPIHYNISKLPEKLKEPILKQLKKIPKEYTSVIHQLDGILGFIKNGIPDDKIWAEFLNQIEKHDAYRNQDFYKTFYEYANHF